MMFGPLEKFQAYYTKLLLPQTPIQIYIFKNDDAILEKLGACTEFPKSNEKIFIIWILKYHAYFGEEVCMEYADIIG